MAALAVREKRVEKAVYIGAGCVSEREHGRVRSDRTHAAGQGHERPPEGCPVRHVIRTATDARQEYVPEGQEFRIRAGAFEKLNARLVAGED